MDLVLVRRTLTLVGFATLVFTWVVEVWNFGALPAVVPTHFDLSGVPTGYGTKDVLWIAPAAGTVLFGMLVFAQRMDPRFYRYPFKVRADALPLAASYTRTLVALSNVAAMFVFAVLEVAVVRGALKQHLSGGVLALNWVVLGLFLVGLFAYVIALAPYRDRGAKGAP